MSSEVKLPRGIRNNNPLNIRLSSDRWQGQVNGNGNKNSPSPTDKSPSLFGEGLGERPVGGEAVFCVFSSMSYGWRAAFVILCKTYYGKYKLKTIRALITRWAPPKENNTEAYIRRVTDRIGIAADRELGSPQEHPAQWMMIAMAMAIVECGTTQLDYLSMLKGWELAVGK